MKFSTSFIFLACSSAFAAPLLAREPNSAFSEIATPPKIPDSILQSLSEILESSNVLPSVATRSAKDLVLEGISTILSGKKDKHPGSDSDRRNFLDEAAQRIAEAAKAAAEAAQRAAGGSGAGSGSDSDGGSSGAGSGSDSSSRRMIKARQGLNEKKCVFPPGFAGVIPLRCQLQLPLPFTLPPLDPIDPTLIEEADAPEVDARQALDDASCNFPVGFKGIIPFRCRLPVILGGPPIPTIPIDPISFDSVPAPDVEARQGLDEANCVFPPGFEGLIPLRCRLLGAPGPVIGIPPGPIIGGPPRPFDDAITFDSVPAPDVEARQGLDIANCRFPAGFLGLIPERCQNQGLPPFLTPPIVLPDIIAEPEVAARQAVDEANCIFPAGFAGLIPPECAGKFPLFPDITF